MTCSNCGSLLPKRDADGDTFCIICSRPVYSPPPLSTVPEGWRRPVGKYATYSNKGRKVNS